MYSLRTAYDSNDALDYIAELIPRPLELSLGETGLRDQKIQPTVGTHAAVLLDVLVQSLRPRRILEIGTSYGYSACVLGRAAATYGGSVTTIEHNEVLALVARQNVIAADLENRVDVVLGDARQIVPTLDATYGLIFQDGGKDDYIPLLPHIIERLEPSGLLISDDVLFPVMKLPEQVSHWRQSMAEYNRLLRHHSQLRTVWLPIGDGIAISVRRPEPI